MCKVIAVANQKGGVGKTTTALNLGVGLADMGNRVLLIDGDAQGSLTISLGYKEPDRIEVTLEYLICGVIKAPELDADSVELLKLFGTMDERTRQIMLVQMRAVAKI